MSKVNILTAVFVVKTAVVLFENPYKSADVAELNIFISRVLRLTFCDTKNYQYIYVILLGDTWNGEMKYFMSVGF